MANTFPETCDRFARKGFQVLDLWVSGSRKNPFFVLQLWKSYGQMQFSMLNLEKFVSRLEILYYQNWSQVFENMFFLVPLSILTITWRGKGSGGPGHDIQTHRSILYRIEGEKRNLFFTRILLSVHLINLLILLSMERLSSQRLNDKVHFHRFLQYS